MTAFVKLSRWNMSYGTLAGATAPTQNPGANHGELVWVNMDLVTSITQISNKTTGLVYTSIEYASATHDEFGGVSVQEEPLIILQLLAQAKKP